MTTHARKLDHPYGYMWLAGMKNGTAKWEKFVSLKKPNMQPLHGLAIVLPGHLSRRMKTYIDTKTCTQKFTAAFSIIDPKWKQKGILPSKLWPLTPGDSKIQAGDSPETSEGEEPIPGAFLRTEQDRHREQVEVAGWPWPWESSPNGDQRPV